MQHFKSASAAVAGWHWEWQITELLVVWLGILYGTDAQLMAKRAISSPRSRLKKQVTTNFS